MAARFIQDHAARAAAPYLAENLGYQQLVMTAGALSLTVPANATFAVITVEGSATDTVRWRDDGTAPTAAIGNPVPVLVAPAYTPPFQYSGSLAAIQFVGASTSKVNISYYR